MITTSDFKEGLIYEDEGKFLQVISYQHHRKSQSRAKVITPPNSKLKPAENTLKEIDV